MTSACVAIVGAGNLGRRHLQGVLKLDHATQIVVFDPSPDALDAARAATKEVALGHPQSTVSYVGSLSQLPHEIDAAIIATSANVRLQALETLLEVSDPKNILMEKLLFQSLAEFDRAEELLKDRLDRVWVNTARRVMPPHHQIRAFFQGAEITQFTATGGLWGLGTSCIHLLDLLDFYQPGAITDVSTGALSGQILESKRAGFKEITGALTGRLGKAEFTLCSSPDNAGPLRFFIEAQDRFCVVEESVGRAVFYNTQSPQDLKSIAFRLDYISETTTGVIEAMINNQPVGLPNFQTSAALHRPLLAALGRYFADHLGTPDDFVPLT